MMVSFNGQKFHILRHARACALSLSFSLSLYTNIYLFVSHGFGVLSMKPLHNPRPQRFALMLSCSSLIVLILTFTSGIRFEVVVVYGV